MKSSFLKTNKLAFLFPPIGVSIVSFFFLFWINGNKLSAATYHVSKTGSDSNSGLDWTNSFLTLQKALQTVTLGDEIWVAKGTYYPDEGPGMTNDDSNASYSMVNGVGLYGGFNGTEVLKSDRDWLANLTILSGEIGNLSITTDNSYSIIYNINIDNSAILDGFIVEKSYSTIASKFSAIYNKNESPNISNCTIRDNFSRSGPTNVTAGIFYSFCNNIILNNCNFLGNIVENSLGRGGAIHSISSAGSISQCSFENNSSVHSEGGAIYLQGSLKPMINDCEFKLNNANRGGAIYSLGGGNTIESCEMINNSADLGSAIFMSNVTNLNITFKNCLIQNNSTLGNGAVYILHSSKVNFEECIFDNNSGILGVGMYNDESSPKILNCEFKNNTQGNGVYNDNSSPILNSCTFINNIGSSGAGMYNFESIVSLTDCNFISNRVQGQGGAIANDNSTLTLTSCTFEENEAASSKGGAIYNIESDLVISDSYFKSNSSGDEGGAIYDDINANLLEITYSKFENNNSINNGGAISSGAGTVTLDRNVYMGNSAKNGGAIFTKGSIQEKVSNSIFLGNYVTERGGGIYDQTIGGISIFGCSISGNKADLEGGGVYLKGSSSGFPKLMSCIIWNNSSDVFTGGNIYDSRVPTAWLGLGTGNIDSDPLFINTPDYNLAPTTVGDLHVQDCSPVIDKGSDFFNTFTLDLENNPRTYDAITGGSIIDMGAYELQENVDPTAICNSIIAQLDASGSVTITADMIDGGSTGCSELSYLINGQSSINLNCSDIGRNQVILTVTDMNNVSATCVSTITVEDKIAPAIFCPLNKYHANDLGLCSYLVTDSNHATSNDNCSLTNITYSPSFPHTFPVGVSHVIATATDASGNSSNCIFQITVSDLEAPTILCPENITVNAESSSCNKAISFSAIVSDNCPSVITSYSINSGSTFNLGTTAVVATAIDMVGLTASCSFTVTVIDNSGPNLTCPNNIVYNLSSNECNKAITYSATAIDNCNIASITYSPVSGSIFELGTSSVTITATDNSGNSNTCSFTVTITGDDDCDGVANACDVCPGGNDMIDNNNDGQPDCHVYPGYSFLPSSWKCDPGNKVKICHNANNTLCVVESAVPAHLAHGDYCGPCIEANCNNNLEKSENSQEGLQFINSRFDDQSGRNNIISDIHISVLPNPSQTDFVIQVDNHGGEILNFSLYNNLGILIKQFSEINEHSQIRLGNDLVEGIYILQYGNENFSKSLRLIKIR